MSNRIRSTRADAERYRMTALENPALSTMDLWHKLIDNGEEELRCLNLHRIITGATFTELTIPADPQRTYSFHPPGGMSGRRFGTWRVFKTSEIKTNLQCIKCSHELDVSSIEFTNYFRNGISPDCAKCKFEKLGLTVTFEEFKSEGGAGCVICKRKTLPNEAFCLFCKSADALSRRMLQISLSQFIQELNGEW